MTRTDANFAGVQFDPVAARSAAARLDDLADRLESDLHASDLALRVVPASIDEVSERAASTMNEVAASYSDSASTGILELRKLAATLRAQADRFGRSEAESVADISGAV
ncbi:PE family protein [Nocardia beijingensis]|uniref:PE family protein n=1 Tax=Nocardia beijingensis TaxID=95162 RepID=UPI00332F4F8C